MRFLLLEHVRILSVVATMIQTSVFTLSLLFFTPSAVSSPLTNQNHVPRQIIPISSTPTPIPPTSSTATSISIPATTSLIIPTYSPTSSIVPTTVFPSLSTTSGASGPQASSNVTNSKKAGLAWPNDKWADFTQYTKTGKVTWYYTWSPFSVETAPKDLEFVPMLWGPNQVSDFEKTIDVSIQSGSKHVLAMNE